MDPRRPHASGTNPWRVFSETASIPPHSGFFPKPPQCFPQSQSPPPMHGAFCGLKPAEPPHAKPGVILASSRIGRGVPNPPPPLPSAQKYPPKVHSRLPPPASCHRSPAFRLPPSLSRLPLPASCLWPPVSLAPLDHTLPNPQNMFLDFFFCF